MIKFMCAECGYCTEIHTVPTKCPKCGTGRVLKTKDPGGVAAMAGTAPDAFDEISMNSEDCNDISERMKDAILSAAEGAPEPWTEELDFSEIERKEFPPELLERRQWMGGAGPEGKLPFAPWGDPGKVLECNKDGHDKTPACGCDPRWKWSDRDLYLEGEKIRLAEEDPRIKSRAFIHLEEDPFILVDGDDVRDPETGKVHPAFKELLETFGATYLDISISGGGVHAIYKAPEGIPLEGHKNVVLELGEEPFGSNEDPPKCEIFGGDGRVNITTGDHVKKSPLEVNEWRTEEVKEYLKAHGIKEKTPLEEREREPLDLEDHVPTATGPEEETRDPKDIIHALRDMGPEDLPLRTRETGTVSGWKAYDPAYRTSRSGKSLQRPPNSDVFYDQGKEQGFGPFKLFAADIGIISKPWDPLKGEDFWKAVDKARELGAPIPEFIRDLDVDPEAMPPLLEEPDPESIEDQIGEELRGRARKNTKALIAEVQENGGEVLIDALPTLGKSHGVVKATAQTWEPTTVLTSRRDLYYQYKKWAEEENLHYFTLPSLFEHCPTAKGEHGEELEKKIQDLHRRGATASEIHKHLDLPCQEKGSCPYSSMWPEDYDKYDLIIGHYRHAHVPGAVKGRTVIFDEDTGENFETTLEGPNFKGAITHYLQKSDLPFGDLTDLIEKRDGALMDHRDINLNPTWKTENMFKHPDAHAAVELAVYTLLKGEDLGNGWERAQIDHKTVGLFHRETTTFHLIRPPNLDYSSAVIALDGTPTADMWRSRLGVDLKHETVMEEDQRRAYIRKGLNLQIATTTPYIKPYSSGEHVYTEEDQALIEELESHHGRPPSLITTLKAEKKYSEESDILQHVEECKHYGDLKSSNEFSTERLGVVIGSRHYGDEYIQKWSAYLGEAAERGDEKGHALTYGDTGDKILRHMREHETLQAVMRFGRDGKGAVVYVHTNTLPSWVPTAVPTPSESVIRRPRSDAEKRIIKDLQFNPRDRNTGDLAEAADVSERRALQILHDLKSKGLIDCEVEGKNYVWRNDGLHRVNGSGEVELDALDLQSITEGELSEIVGIIVNTRYFGEKHTEDPMKVKIPEKRTIAAGDPQNVGPP